MGKAKIIATNGGPYLTAGFICEKVLIERDLVTSFMRTADGVELPRPKKEFAENMVVALDMKLIIAFKAGDFRREQHLKIEQVLPSGTRAEFVPDHVLNFVGPNPESGHTLHVAVHIKWGGEGLYRFDVFLEGVLRTRVPIRVALAKTKHGPRSSVDWADQWHLCSRVLTCPKLSFRRKAEYPDRTAAQS